jgi:hypothetical protein
MIEIGIIQSTKIKVCVSASRFSVTGRKIASIYEDGALRILVIQLSQGYMTVPCVSALQSLAP